MSDLLPQKQQQMHKDFFDKCQDAIDRGFYLEAIAMEYAAIEGRLEVMLGIFGMPCSKDASPEIRKDIKISHRITCLDNIRKHSPIMDDTKLDRLFFNTRKKKILMRWTNERNIYIHALYKNADLYQKRKAECQTLAVEGKEYCRLFYNEVKRLRRLKKNNPGLFECYPCKAKCCKAFREKD